MMKPFMKLRSALFVGLLAGLFAAAVVYAGGQRNPQAGGSFLPSADYDLAGDVRFTASALNNSLNPVLVGGSQSLTNKTLISPTITPAIINTGTLTLPTATGSVTVLLECGATGTGNQTCSPATPAATTKIYAGQSTLSSNAAVITFPTLFAATTSYRCLANDITTRANPVQMISTSTSSATITNTTGASDVINWICIGQ